METGWVLAGTTFLASAVEAVEALTIVLAVGITRSWRASLSGAAWALVVLAAIVVIFGPAIVTYVPLNVLKIVIGLLLLLFGLAWLRKAVLRASGRKALHDEDAIYAREVAALRAAGKPVDGRDRIGFVTSFNAVLLEGLEVAVIVLTFGTAGRGGLVWASIGAFAAVAIVTLAGVVVRKPFAAVPENVMKFIVGIMLTSFGTYWSGEGLGIAWWHDDLSIVGIVVVLLAVCGVTIAVAKRARPVETRSAA